MKIGINGLALIKENTGIGNYIIELVNSMAKQFKEDEYIIFAKKSENIRKYFCNEVQIIGVPMVAGSRFSRIFAEQVLLPFMVSGIGIDVVFSPAFSIPLLSRKRQVVTVHDLAYKVYPEASSIKQRVAMRLFFDSSIRMADQVIAVSDSTKSDIKKFFHDVKSVATIHEGVRHVGVSSEVRPSTIGDKENFAVVVGTITPRKNAMGIIKSFERIMNETDINLVFAGGFAWKNREVLEYIEKKGLSGRVRLLGYIDDCELAWCYRNARMLLYCSFYEGFGFPPLEAMAYGTPVIASDVSSIPEVVGDAALLVDPCDIEAIGGAILMLDRDSELRKDLVNKGKVRYRLFTWEKAARDTRELFLSMKGKVE